MVLLTIHTITDLLFQKMLNITIYLGLSLLLLSISPVLSTIHIRSIADDLTSMVFDEKNNSLYITGNDKLYSLNTELDIRQEHEHDSEKAITTILNRNLLICQTTDDVSCSPFELQSSNSPVNTNHNITGFSITYNMLSTFVAFSNQREQYLIKSNTKKCLYKFNSQDSTISEMDHILCSPPIYPLASYTNEDAVYIFANVIEDNGKLQPQILELNKTNLELIKRNPFNCGSNSDDTVMKQVVIRKSTKSYYGTILFLNENTNNYFKTEFEMDEKIPDKVCDGKFLLQNLSNVTSMESIIIDEDTKVLYFGQKNGKVKILMPKYGHSCQETDLDGTAEVRDIKYLETTGQLAVLHSNQITVTSLNNCTGVAAHQISCLHSNQIFCGWCVKSASDNGICSTSCNNGYWQSTVKRLKTFHIPPLSIKRPTFQIDMSFYPAESFKCYDDSREGTPMTLSSNTNNQNLSCTFDILSNNEIKFREVPTNIKGQDRDDIAAQTNSILLYNCSAIESVNECVSKNYLGNLCKWCLCSKKCIEYNNTCLGTESFIQSSSELELRGLPNTVQVGTYNNITVRNKLIQGSFECDEQNIYDLTCVIDGNKVLTDRHNGTITCMNLKMNLTGRIEFKIADLPKKYLDITDFCAQLQDCNSCKYFNVNKQCKWCQRGCVHQVLCNQEADCIERNFEDIKADIVPFSKGPRSGGTQISIIGNGLDFGQVEETVIRIGNFSKCVVTSISEKRINCTTEPGDGKGHQLYVEYSGGLLKKNLDVMFSYFPDPEVDQIIPNTTFQSGGADISVIGSGFDVIQHPEMGLSGVSGSFTLCHQDKRNDTQILCPAPSLTNNTRIRKRRSMSTQQQQLVFKMDGVTLNSPITYGADPVFYEFMEDGGVRIFTPDSRYIFIKGERLNETARITDYQINVGVELCEIVVSSFSSNQLKCYPPVKPPNKANEDSLYPEVQVKVGKIHKYLGYLQYKESTDTMIIIVCVLSIVIIIVIIGGIVLFKYKVHQKSKKMKDEIEKTELAMVEQCREVFVELQTDMTDVTEQLIEYGVPYNKFIHYIFQTVFPNHPIDSIQEHPIYKVSKHHEGSEDELKAAMMKLDQLVSNKFFLVSAIRTFDKEVAIKPRKNSDLAGYLTFLLMNNMNYFTEIVDVLLSKIITESIQKKSHKSLFTMYNTVTEKLMLNWLSIVLYNDIKKSAGPSLYMLIKAIENLCIKWPMDDVTHKIRATLCEENLLTLNIEPEELTLNVKINYGSFETKCRVLDCDTINQVKIKCLNAAYKLEAASDKPKPDDVDLAWLFGDEEQILYNEDMSSIIVNGYRKLNTLKHYGVTNNSIVFLLSKSLAKPNNIYINYGAVSDDNESLFVQSEDTESVERVEAPSLTTLPKLHLEKQTRNKESHKAAVELNFNRLLRTKVNLKKYIDNLIKSILDTSNIPTSLHHLFNIFASQQNMLDKQVLESWKVNSYFLKFWTRLLSQPELLFDLSNSYKDCIQTNINVVAVAFTDSFKPTSTLDKKSSVAKLLFYKDCQEYRLSAKHFLKISKMASDVHIDDLSKELTEISNMLETSSLNRISILYEVFQDIDRYDDQILADLDDNEETSALRLSEKLEGVFETLRNT